MVIHKMALRSIRSLGIYLPLIATNCAVLGLADQHPGRPALVTTVLYDFGSLGRLPVWPW